MRQHDSMLTTHSRPPAGIGRRLRVLLVVEAAGGGTGRHVLDLAGGLAARGCEVHLLYSPVRMDKVFAERIDRLASDAGMTCSALHVRSSIHPSDFAAALRVRRYLRTHGPFEVVHGHSSKGGALARLAAFGTGCPAVYTPHGLVVADPSLPLAKRAIYLAIEWSLSRLTRRIITVSPEEYRSSVRSGLGRRRLVMVPNGVDDAGPAVTRSEARRSLGLTDEAIVVGFVGRLVEAKAPQLIVEAFATVADAAPDARLVIVGDGPLMSRLREVAATHLIDDRVLFLGHCDARDLYTAFDVFAICSRKEGLPYVVLEAMAAGLPVAATATAGVELLVEQGVNGEVVPGDDVAALATALGRLLSDATLRTRYAGSARARAARFTVTVMVDETLAVYRAVIGAGKAHVPPSAAIDDGLDAPRALEVA